MSLPKLGVYPLAAAFAFALAAGAAAAGPGLGVPASEAEIAAWDIGVMPDGAGLPPGSGDAAAGKTVFEARCAACHGADAAGGEGLADPLVGGIGSLATEKPLKTVGSFWPYATTLFDYIRRAMPYDSPMSLGDDEVYAVTAFILARNGIIGEGARLDAQSLAAVKMPNRDGFVPAWPAR